MTKREIKITRHTLDYLHSLDYGQATEVQIHANAFGDQTGSGLIPPPSAREVEATIKFCETEKWISGVPARFGNKMKWNITDAGEAARLEM